jgi:enoyl-CoA hydratase/carnithine racemase
MNSLNNVPLTESDTLSTEVRNGVGFITLNRPSALNTINIAMVRVMHKALLTWAENASVKAVVVQGSGEKAFCAGGDVRRVHECITKGLEEYHVFFKEEFALNEYIYNYPKPYVALMNGIVMGGGMGIAQGATYRVVNETTKIAMPETAIGYFPDVGGSYFLTRTNPSIGKYLGLTGKHINHHDALFCNLADWTLPLKQWNNFTKELELVDSKKNPIDQSIEDILIKLGASQSYEQSNIQDSRTLIESVFSRVSLHAIFESLHEHMDQSWAQETTSSMLRNSPLAMAATLQLLTQGSKLGLSECFAVELELTKDWHLKGEFLEGVRAALIDKDKNPKWKYSLNEVDTNLIKKYFPCLFRYQ